MSTLTYWVCESLYDAIAYNIRAKTRREAIIQKMLRFKPDGYTQPYKVSVKYTDAFSLMESCLTDGGAGWEVSPQPGGSL